MIERKKKLRIIQISLLVIGALIILFTYSSKNRSAKEEIIPKKTLERIKKQQKSTKKKKKHTQNNYRTSKENQNIRKTQKIK